MSATAQPLVTVEELWLRPDDGLRHELVRGELRTMTPAGAEHGLIAGNLLTSIGTHALQHNLGRVLGADPGFVLQRNPDSVRAPDVAFVTAARLPAPLPRGYFPGPPDLAVEVVSPNDRLHELEAKVQDWLRAGCREVWVVSPRLKTIAIHRPRADVLVLTEADTLESSELLPGFACSVAEVFAL